ncbi:mitochondrial cardiolipin hydrolase [Brachionichthys hirsutus]|uniref:mitochondrial cardiolipin hydrolase n=1 Tax=Brachionichthys hirsutus TaxID=412623 RepID=UPI003604A7B1
MWNMKMVGLGVVAFSLSLELIGRLLCRLRRGRNPNEVLFFPSDTTCLENIFNPSPPRSCFCPLPHGAETSFSRLLRRIMSVSSSLDLCIFAFSNTNLSRALLALQSRGVVIRVLSDKNYATITGSQIGVLRKAGIRVRCSNRSEIMHHKFAVLDGRLLVTGSLNWTQTAVFLNEENILIIEDPDLVRPFLQEFNRLWDLNDPAQVDWKVSSRRLV